MNLPKEPTLNKPPKLNPKKANIANLNTNENHQQNQKPSQKHDIRKREHAFPSINPLISQIDIKDNSYFKITDDNHNNNHHHDYRLITEEA